MNDQPIAVATFRVVDQAIWTIEPVGMLFAGVVRMGAHHVTTVIGHAAASHTGLMSAMASGPEWPLLIAPRPFRHSREGGNPVAALR
jgi:hypothetical protein